MKLRRWYFDLGFSKLRDIEEGDSGMFLGERFCITAQQKKGGWVEYHMKKPGENEVLRKMGYLRSVEGTNFHVGSGFYDAAAKTGDLTKLSDAYTPIP